LTPLFRSIRSAPPCRRQAEIERAQIVFNRSQPSLPRSTGCASPVFERLRNKSTNETVYVNVNVDENNIYIAAIVEGRI